MGVLTVLELHISTPLLFWGDESPDNAQKYLRPYDMLKQC